MKKKIFITIIYLIGIIAIVCGTFGGYYAWSQNLPHVYQNTYYAALVDKVNYLESHKKDKKILLVGGSNVAFGFDSSLLEQEFSEYKVVNFGLYAGLGTKIMMDLSKPYIGKDDMVFLLPETNVQSMSLFFSPVSAWKAIEDRANIYNLLPKSNQKQMRGNYFSYVKEKSKFAKPIEVSGIYQRHNFNDHFDFHYVENGISLRDKNQMAQHFDPTTPVDYSAEMINSDFLDYVNEYKKYVDNIGGNLYFGFCPVNNLCIKNGDAKNLSNFYWELRQKLDCEIVGNPQEYLLDPHYFFDSNFHLNDAGAKLRTKLFVEDVYRDVAGKAKASSVEVPNLPEYPDIVIGPDSESAKYFDYRANQTGWTLVKVKSEYEHLGNIDIPEFLDNKCFNLIEKNCFSECDEVNSLVIPKSMTALGNGAFANKHKLRSIKLLYSDPSKTLVDYSGQMTMGVLNDFKIYVPSASYSSYMTDYYWGIYASFLEGY
jgi:hypothetical protein